MAEPTWTGLLRAFSLAPFRFRLFIIILAACGLIPYWDILCVLLASIYLYIMSRYVLPPVTPESPPSIYKGSKVLRVYVTVAAYVGLYLPLAYVLLGVSMGDKKAVQAAASHTFFLASQVVSERVSSTSNAVSLPARAFVPILYNSGRIVSIWAWVQTEFSKHIASSLTISNSPLSAAHWVVCGRVLAVANLVLWCYNLFCFLVPMYLPACFRKYFEDEKAWSQQRRETK